MAESSQSLGGSIASLVGGKSADDKLVQDFLSNTQNRALTQYSKSYRPDKLGIPAAFDAYNTAYSANNPTAQANADYYNQIAKGIFSNPQTQTGTYEQLRSGNLSSLADTYKDVLNFGLAGQKAKLAAGGYGNTGPSAYDRILSSTMTASNLAPVLQTIYGNLGRDASSAYGADRAWDAYRLGQFGSDPLTGYLDASTAGRAINPLLTHIGLLNAGVGGLAQLSPLYGANSAGFHVQKGLSSRLNDFAQATQNAAKFASSFMGGGMGGAAGGMGGLGGMMGGVGGSQGGTSGPSGAMSAPQAQNWMSEYNGGNPYGYQAPPNYSPPPNYVQQYGGQPNYAQPYSSGQDWLQYNNSPAIGNTFG